MRRAAYASLLLLAASLPLESAYEVPGVGTLSRGVGMLTALLWLLSVIASGRVRRPHPQHVAALAFLLWCACSVLWTVDGPATEARVLTYGQLLLLMVLVWDLVTSVAALQAVLLAYVCGCWAALASLFIGLATGTGSELHGRATVSGFNPNDTGVILAFGMLVACYLAADTCAERRSTQVRIASVSYLPLALLAVLGTGSRSALLAVLPAAAYGVVQLRRHHPTAAFAAVGTTVLLALAAIPFVPDRALMRLTATASDLSAGDLNMRQVVWGEAVRIIEQSPWTGIGAGAFRTAATAINKVGHNFVLALLAEVGVVGLALYLLMLGLSVHALHRAPRSLREMWWALSLVWVGTALFHNWENRKLTWLLLGLMAASSALRMASPGPVTEAGVSRVRPVEESQPPGLRLH